MFDLPMSCLLRKATKNSTLRGKEEYKVLYMLKGKSVVKSSSKSVDAAKEQEEGNGCKWG